MALSSWKLFRALTRDPPGKFMRGTFVPRRCWFSDKHPFHPIPVRSRGMFHYRSNQLDPRLAAIAGHLRAIEKDLGILGRRAGQGAADRASAAGDQIADMLGPILSDIGGRFRRGQRAAVDEAANFGN